MIIISLPLPPSVNCLYSGKGRRYKSKRYEKWEISARAAMRYQQFKPYGKIPLQVHYKFGRPDMRTRDLGNLIKACEDFMVHEGIIADDSWIHRMELEWADVQGAVIEISLLKEPPASLARPSESQS